jgi:hypothetical protein
MRHQYEKSAKCGPSPICYMAYGETKSLIKWSADPRCVCSYRTLRARVFQLEWAIERSLSEPTRQCLTKKQRKQQPKKPDLREVLVSAWGITMSLANWAKQKYVTVSLATLSRRISRDRWPPEKALMTPSHRGYKIHVYNPLAEKSPWDMTLSEYTQHCLRQDTVPRGLKY